MAPQDPWLWTAEDLVDQICQSTNLFTATGQVIPSFSKRSALATEIRSNAITGAAFMTNIDANVLRHVKASTITSIVDLLRSGSLLYQQHTATAGVQDLTMGNNQAEVSQVPTVDTGEKIAVSASGRKRRKISHLQTLPLPVRSDAESYLNFPGSSDHHVVGREGTYDYLKHWEQAEDEEADDEDEDDFDDLGDEPDDEEELIVEAEDEELPSVQNPAKRAGKLSHDEIADIINERIDFYASQWQPGKGRDEPMPDPVALWEEAESEGRRQHRVNVNKMNAEFFRDRLDKLGDEIMRSPWTTADGVRRVCVSLEITVDLLEEAEWLLRIYELSPENESNSSGNVDEDVKSNIDHYNRSAEIIDLGSGSDTSDSREEDRDDVEVLVDVDETSTEAAQHLAINRPTSIRSPRATEPLATVSIEPSGSSVQDIIPVLSVAEGPMRHGDKPEIASIRSVSRWEWDDLVATADRKRIVMKVVQEMDTADRDMIRNRVNTVRKKNVLTEISACVRMWLRKESRMPGILPKDLAKITTVAKLFLCWWIADNCFMKDAKEWRMEELSICLDEGCEDPGIFYDWVHHIFANTFSEEACKTPHAPSQAEYIVISDDEDALPAPTSTQRRVSMQAAARASQPEVMVLD